MSSWTLFAIIYTAIEPVNLHSTLSRYSQVALAFRITMILLHTLSIAISIQTDNFSGYALPCMVSDSFKFYVHLRLESLSIKYGDIVESWTYIISDSPQFTYS